MSLTRRNLIAAGAAVAAALPLGRARAAGPVIRFGVLNDLS